MVGMTQCQSMTPRPLPVNPILLLYNSLLTIIMTTCRDLADTSRTHASDKLLITFGIRGVIYIAALVLLYSRLPPDSSQQRWAVVEGRCYNSAIPICVVELSPLPRYWYAILGVVWPLVALEMYIRNCDRVEESESNGRTQDIQITDIL